VGDAAQVCVSSMPPIIVIALVAAGGAQAVGCIGSLGATAVAVAVAAIVVTRVIFELRLVVEVPVVWGCINRQGAQREELKAWEHKSGNKER